MKKPAGQDANTTAVPPADAAGSDPFGMAQWLRQMPDVPLHPLMAHPVAAMAATTAIGLGVVGQMAGAMLGLMQGAAEEARAVLAEAGGIPATAGAGRERAKPVRTKPVLRVVPKEPAVGVEAPGTAMKTTVARDRNATPGKGKAATTARTKKADDLKVISGIGPKLEQVLNGMGFRRYDDIAALTAEDVARIEAELGVSGRIARDGWVEQARTLAKGRGRTRPGRQ